MNIQPVGFLDTSQFTATFVNKHRAQMKNDRLELRTEKGDLPILKDWKSGRSLLSRVRNDAAKVAGKACELGMAAVDVLAAGEVRDWSIEEDEYALAYLRIVIALVPSPGAWLYCGGEGSVLPVGQVTLMNRQAWHCEANFGPCARVNLLIDVKRPGD